MFTKASKCRELAQHARSRGSHAFTHTLASTLRYVMFYAQSTAKGHIRAKQNVFLPQKKGLLNTEIYRPSPTGFMKFYTICIREECIILMTSDRV